MPRKRGRLEGMYGMHCYKYSCFSKIHVFGASCDLRLTIDIFIKTVFSFTAHFRQFSVWCVKKKKKKKKSGIIEHTVAPHVVTVVVLSNPSFGHFDLGSKRAEQTLPYTRTQRPQIRMCVSLLVIVVSLSVSGNYPPPSSPPPPPRTLPHLWAPSQYFC